MVLFVRRVFLFIIHCKKYQSQFKRKLDNIYMGFYNMFLHKYLTLYDIQQNLQVVVEHLHF